MKKIICIAILIFSFSIFAFAQSSENGREINCPTLSVTSPPTAHAPGENVVFTANLVGGDFQQEEIKYVWSIDRGKIIEGQGTPFITVSTEGLQDETITATVRISGLPAECPDTASDSTLTVCGGINAVLTDEFGDIPSGDLKARLDNFLVALQNEPNAQGYVIGYGSAKDIEKREAFIKNYILMRNFDAAKIVFKDGGSEKEIRTRLWIVPQGADSSTIN